MKGEQPPPDWRIRGVGGYQSVFGFGTGCKRRRCPRDCSRRARHRGSRSPRLLNAGSNGARPMGIAIDSSTTGVSLSPRTARSTPDAASPCAEPPGAASAATAKPRASVRAAQCDRKTPRAHSFSNSAMRVALVRLLGSSQRAVLWHIGLSRLPPKPARPPAQVPAVKPRPAEKSLADGPLQRHCATRFAHTSAIAMPEGSMSWRLAKHHRMGPPIHTPQSRSHFPLLKQTLPAQTACPAIFKRHAALSLHCGPQLASTTQRPAPERIKGLALPAMQTPAATSIDRTP